MKLTRCYRGGDIGERAGWWLSFSYDPGTVELLKKLVPHTHRSWSETAKEWWVASEYEDALAEILVNFSTFRDQPALL